MRILENIWNKAILKYKKVKVGKNLHIGGKIYVHGRKNGIEIGNDCTIYSSGLINPTSGINQSHFVVGPNASLIIGNNVGLSHVNITAYNSVSIEDDVLLGSGVKIWDTDFHPVDFKNRIEKQPGKTAPIVVKKGAFIGACSIVLKGVTIGENAVVGAGSVVTKDIPPKEVWAGNPAKYIRKI